MIHDQKIRLHLKSIVPFLIFLAIAFSFYLKYYLSGNAVGDADVLQYFSSKHEWSHQLLKGNYQLWNPYLAGGMPQVAISDGYIISTLLAFLPLREYMYSYYIFHLFIGAAFFFLYLKEIECDTLPAFCMAVIFECSIQINGLRKGHPTIIAAICLFPIVMYLVNKFFNANKIKWLLLSALAMGMMFTIGLQHCAYALPILFIYLLFKAINRRYNAKTIICYSAAWIFGFFGFISYRLVPTLGVMSEYSAMGSSETTFETFASYSLHPIKIFIMIYPRLFDGLPISFGIMNSSENDMELYLGILVLILAIFVSVYSYKNKNVLIEILIAIIALAYSCIGHLSRINKIVYKIPVFGGFRCSGRILFIFYFFVFTLAARGLNELYKESDYENKYILVKNIIKKITILNLCLGAATCFVYSLGGEENLDFINKAIYVFKIPTFITCLLCICGLFYEKKLWVKENIKGIMICIFVLFITLSETLPYSLVTACTDINGFRMKEEQVKLLSDERFKVWDAFEGVDGAHYSIISQNRNVIEKVASVNAYTAYNNPYLAKFIKNFGENNDKIPFNFSGLQTGSLNAQNNVIYQNGFLSMLGVKYLIDSSGIISEHEGNAYIPHEEGALVYSNEELVTDISNEDLLIKNISIKVEEDTLYRIDFEIENKDKLKFLSLDLYGGSSYDYAEQEKEIDLSSENVMPIYLYSGDISQAEESVVLRVLGVSDLDSIKLRNFKVTTVPYEQCYRMIYEDESAKIYENLNARELIYFPAEVKQTKDVEKIYQTISDYDLCDVAYQTRIPDLFVTGICTVKDITMGSNIITAEIETEKASYLCCSQVYSNKWKVYIDGKRHAVDLVNGIIMGVEVPAGFHTVEFKYFDYYYLIGCIISIIVIMTLIIYINLKDKIFKKVS